ncbi:MAG: hypothetical protein ACM3SW_00135 [Actinomycetota bacterium]
MKRDAPEVLKLGAKKEIVVRFFQENGIPPEFLGNEITGTIHLKGCAPSGCGSDDALLGLRVGVDKKGTVTSKPSVGALYTDCLQALSAGGIPFACSGFGDSRLNTL